MDNSTEHIIKDIAKRAEQLEKTTIHIIETHKDHEIALENQQILFGSKIDLMKQDLDEVRDLCHTLSQSIKQIGRQLKGFVSKDELDMMREQVDERKQEEYITRDELKRTYDFYAHSK